MASRYAEPNLDKTLTAFGSQAMGDGGQRVGEIILPVVRVPKTDFRYYRFGTRAEHVKDDFDIVRAPKTESSEASRFYTNATDSCDQYALHEKVAQEEIDNAAGTAINPLQDAVTMLLGKIYQRMEIDSIDLVMNESVFTNTGAAGAKWDAATTSIRNDVNTGKLSVLKESGLSATHIVIPYTLALKLADQSEIYNNVHPTSSEFLTEEGLPKRLFGLTTVVPKRINDEAAVGVSTPSMDLLCDDFDVVVLAVTPPSSKAGGAGYTFRRALGGSMEVQVYRWYNDDKHCHVVEVMIEQKVKAVNIAAAYVITDADD